MRHPRHLLHNAKLKAMALLLAVLSWGIVKQITNNETVIADVPVVVVFPTGWAIRDQDVTSVDLTFRGTREDLLLLDERTVEVIVDLRDREFQQYVDLELSPRMVTYTESNARVTHLDPQQVSLRFGRESSKDLPVLVNQSGTPPEGLTVESIQLEPSVVTLHGADELLSTVSSLQTSPLNLSDRIRSFEQRLDVKPPNEGWVGRIQPQRVLARVTLSGVTAERRYDNIPLLVVHPANQAVNALAVLPDKVNVFLEASPQHLDELEPSDIKAFVSAEGGPGVPREVRVLAPPGVSVLGVSPETVRLQPLPTPAPSNPSVSPSPHASSP